MRSCIILLLSVSFCIGAVINNRILPDTSQLSEAVNSMEEVIFFCSTNILLVDEAVDGLRHIPFDTGIKKIVVCFEDAGSSDSTMFDIRKVTADSSQSILGARNYPTIKAGDNRNCVEFKPDLVIDLNEDDVIRMDILNVAGGDPKNFTIALYLWKGIPKK